VSITPFVETIHGNASLPGVPSLSSSAGNPVPAGKLWVVEHVTGWVHLSGAPTTPGGPVEVSGITFTPVSATLGAHIPGILYVPVPNAPLQEGRDSVFALCTRIYIPEGYAFEMTGLGTNVLEVGANITGYLVDA
jgi:hypothetical protein